MFEIFQPKENVTIKLKNGGGYEEVKQTKTITIDGKNIEISPESFENLKQQLSQ